MIPVAAEFDTVRNQYAEAKKKWTKPPRLSRMPQLNLKRRRKWQDRSSRLPRQQPKPPRRYPTIQYLTEAATKLAARSQQLAAEAEPRLPKRPQRSRLPFSADRRLKWRKAER